MESLRRARFVWACLCIAAGLGLNLILTFSPTPMTAARVVLTWAALWLWLPLYLHWSALTRLAAVWFLGAVPLTMLMDRNGGEAMMYAIMMCAAGAVALVFGWAMSGALRQRS